jgi:Holliday junction resolvase
MGFQSRVIKEYEENGYLVLKIIKLSKAGYPDLQCIKDGKSIFIECKEKNDTLKPLQKFRIDELKKYGCDAFCLQDVKGVIY